MALSHVLLTMLLETPESGYDLTKAFDARFRFFWQATHQQVYRELAKLLDDGMVKAANVAQSKRPDKKIYRITPAGKQALRDWMAAPPNTRPVNDEILVRMLGVDLYGKEDALKMLGADRDSHRSLLAEFRKIEAGIFKATPVSKMTLAQRAKFLALRKGIRMEEARLNWAMEAIEAFGKN